ncbi:MAG: heavy-metal-associated domain-containing protein [Promethearchaeota archaeon]
MSKPSEIQSSENQSEADTLTKLNLNIQGMTCANCSLKINKKLDGLKGVHRVDVVLPTESATLYFDNQEVSIDSILGAVRDVVIQHPYPEFLLN